MVPSAACDPLLGKQNKRTEEQNVRTPLAFVSDSRSLRGLISECHCMPDGQAGTRSLKIELRRSATGVEAWAQTSQRSAPCFANQRAAQQRTRARDDRPKGLGAGCGRRPLVTPIIHPWHLWSGADPCLDRPADLDCRPRNSAQRHENANRKNHRRTVSTHGVSGDGHPTRRKNLAS